MKRKYMYKHEKDELKKRTIALYNQGIYQNEICTQLQICSHSVKSFLKEEGLVSRKFRANKFNESYFKKIDSEDKAYFLGLLYADGNVYEKRRRTQITLLNEDSYILDKFSECINSTAKLYVDREKYSKLILDSKELFDDLVKLGCVPKKSLILKFPTEQQVPGELMNHFIRGCFDGDGHVSKKGNCFNVNFTSSMDFIHEFIKLLNSLDIKHTGSKKRYKNNIISAHQIYIRSNSAKKFLDYIYDSATYFIKRKKHEADKLEITYEIKLCEICRDKHFAKGFCKKHYRNNYYKTNNK